VDAHLKSSSVSGARGEGTPCEHMAWVAARPRVTASAARAPVVLTQDVSETHEALT
jgi:hypothetical protein